MADPYTLAKTPIPFVAVTAPVVVIDSDPLLGFTIRAIDAAGVAAHGNGLDRQASGPEGLCVYALPSG